VTQALTSSRRSLFFMNELIGQSADCGDGRALQVPHQSPDVRLLTRSQPPLRKHAEEHMVLAFGRIGVTPEEPPAASAVPSVSGTSRILMASSKSGRTSSCQGAS
jgi:hypothetical protein